MRIIFAALLGAAVAMPSLASEAPSIADPTDPTVSVPTETVPPLTESYKAFEDKPVGSWRDLNNAVAAPAKKPGMSGMAGMSGMDHSKMPPKAEPSSKTGTSNSPQTGQTNRGGTDQ
ncbi:MAG: hypothetical protein JWQ50_2555 [Caballeronia mineralivorans]|nr:hypothetical protein [Caballeronia mineralivorans]